MTIDEIKERGLLLMECISGSRAYGLDRPQSDTDIRGVFYMPREGFYGLEYIPQVANESNDVVYYEIGRFTELLLKSNPTALELLATPEGCVLYRDERMDDFHVENFLSKQCENTFAGYAMSQIRKARGLNKKVLNPVDSKRKPVTEFCYIISGGHAIPLPEWLSDHDLSQQQAGLAAMDHMINMYALYINREGAYKGIIRNEEATDVALSMIEKGEKPAAHMFFNQPAFSAHCREYKAYWEWVKKRNEARYKNTLTHGKNYDAKNMMHTFRLLKMAGEIAREGVLRVKRPDRDFLLDIKSGRYEYDTLMDMAEKELHDIKKGFEDSRLPNNLDQKEVSHLLANCRAALYG
ncbi:DNA polymerase beta superfamily protein [Roseivirga sp. BDSF3-8]|uniref:DNA polymerase beta superfamily protein n=1 Tax=Roseivirga sp. BDSF3-8 TaxID=3241598 RepID=UPI003531DC40